MLRFVVLSVLLASVSAYGSGYGNRGMSYDGGLRSNNYGSNNYGSNYESSGYSSGGYSSGGYSGGVINAAIQSRRYVKFVDVPSTFSAAEPLTIDVPAGQQPLNFLFRSKSSPINVESAHEPGQGSYRETSSQDEPHVLVHTVTRPIVQELREIITPYRKVRQEIQPVQEEVNTLVTRGQERSYGQNYNQGYGSNQGGYSSNQGGYSSNQGGYGSNQGGYSSGGYSGMSYGNNQY